VAVSDGAAACRRTSIHSGISWAKP
jgi:hypothetical protein